MSTASRTIKVLLGILCVAVALEGLLLYQQEVRDAHALEAQTAVAGLSNAALLSIIRQDITEKRYDDAVQKIDLSVQHAVKWYTRKKSELKFALPGETEALNTIQKHASAVDTGRSPEGFDPK